MQLYLLLEYTNIKCFIQHNYCFPFLFDSCWVACNFRISWRLRNEKGNFCFYKGNNISANLN